jgi:ribosomal protein S18 acetylase RimI-like enzyme
LDVADGNEKAINFYANQGFQTVEQKNESIDAETIKILIMERELNI